MTTFEKLKQISNDYRATVDALGAEYELASKEDALFSEEVKAQRIQTRNADFNGRISRAAERAQTEADQEIASLRGALQRYITTSAAPTTMQTLQALIASGVELSGTEIAAFAKNGGYAVLRMLEGPSKGRVTAPSPELLEREFKDLEFYFRDIGAYRGGLAAIGPGGYLGLSATVGSIVMQGQLDHFEEKMDAMAERWADITSCEVKE